METYASYKKEFISDKYLDLIPVVKYSIALKKSSGSARIILESNEVVM